VRSLLFSSPIPYYLVLYFCYGKESGLFCVNSALQRMRLLRLQVTKRCIWQCFRACTRMMRTSTPLRDRHTGAVGQ
jgi:hypothetical protein